MTPEEEILRAIGPTRGAVVFVACISAAVVFACILLAAHFIAADAFLEARIEEIGR
jgi:hypothetical protein